MPLKKGIDEETIRENIRKLILEGYAPAQAEAIARNYAKRNPKR